MTTTFNKRKYEEIKGPVALDAASKCQSIMYQRSEKMENNARAENICPIRLMTANACLAIDIWCENYERMDHIDVKMDFWENFYARLLAFILPSLYGSALPSVNQYVIEKIKEKACVFDAQDLRVCLGSLIGDVFGFLRPFPRSYRHALLAEDHERIFTTTLRSYEDVIVFMANANVAVYETIEEYADSASTKIETSGVLVALVDRSAVLKNGASGNSVLREVCLLLVDKALESGVVKLHGAEGNQILTIGNDTESASAATMIAHVLYAILSAVKHELRFPFFIDPLLYLDLEDAERAVEDSTEMFYSTMRGGIEEWLCEKISNGGRTSDLSGVIPGIETYADGIEFLKEQAHERFALVAKIIESDTKNEAARKLVTPNDVHRLALRATSRVYTENVATEQFASMGFVLRQFAMKMPETRTLLVEHYHGDSVIFKPLPAKNVDTRPTFRMVEAVFVLFSWLETKSVDERRAFIESIGATRVAQRESVVDKISVSWRHCTQITAACFVELNENLLVHTAFALPQDLFSDADTTKNHQRISIVFQDTPVVSAQACFQTLRLPVGETRARLQELLEYYLAQCSEFTAR